MSQKDIWRYIHIRWAGIIVHLCPFTDTRGVNGQRREREKKKAFLDWVYQRETIISNTDDCTPFPDSVTSSTRAAPLG
jgi:hypothetical protein